MTDYQGFPIEFPRCPQCGTTDRVAALALQAIEQKSGVKNEESFFSVEKILAPLVNPQKITGLTVPVLMYHYDICAGCGLRRCVRVEIINAPITAQAPPPGGQGFPPFGMPGGGLGWG